MDEALYSLPEELNDSVADPSSVEVDSLGDDTTTIDKAIDVSEENIRPPFLSRSKDILEKGVSIENLDVVDDDQIGFTGPSELGFNFSNAEPTYGNAQSDIATMTAPSYGFYIKQKYKGMGTFVQRGHLGYAAMMGSISNEEASAYGDIDFLNGVNGVMPNVKHRGVLMMMAGESASLSKYMVENMTAGAKTAGLAAGSALVLGSLGPQAAVPEEILTVPFFATHGYAVGAIRNTAIVEGGALYLDLIENDVDPKVAKVLSLSAGTTIGLIEQFGFMQLTKPARKAIMGKVLTSPSTKRWIANNIMTFAKSVGVEIITEDIQEGVSIVAESYAYKISEQPEKMPTFDEIYERIAETTKATAAGTPLFAGFGTGMQASMSHPSGKLSVAQRSILNEIKGKIAKEGEFVEKVPENVDMNKRVDDISVTFKKDEAGDAKIDVDFDNREIKVYDVKLEAKDVMATAKVGKDGNYHIKTNPENAESNANVIIETFEKNKIDGEVTYNEKGDITISGVEADVIENMIRPESQNVISSLKPYIFKNGTYDYTAASKKEADIITNMLKNIGKNPVVNVEHNVIENPDGTYSISFKIDSVAESLSKRIDTDTIKVTAENLDKIIEDNLLEWADGEAITAIGKSVGKLLAGKKLSKAELKAMPKLAEIQDTILDLVVEYSSDKTLFERASDKIAIVEMISDFIKDSGMLSEEKVQPLIDFFEKTIKEQTALSMDINLLSDRLKEFKKGLDKGRKTTLREVKAVKKLIAQAIKKAIPRDIQRQAEFLKKLNRITTVKDLLAKLDGILHDIEEVRIDFLKEKILKIDTDKLPSLYRDQIDIIKKAIREKDKSATALTKSIKAMYESMTDIEKEHFFGDVKDLSDISADSLEKVAAVAKYLEQRGKLEQKMLSFDRMKSKNKAIQHFKNQISEKGNPKNKNAQAMHLAGKGKDVAGAEPKTLLKSMLWILRGPTLFKFMGLSDLFKSFIKADLNYRENMRRTNNIMNSFLSDESMYQLLNEDVGFTLDDLEYTTEQLIDRFQLEEEEIALVTNQELITTRGLSISMVKKAMRVASRSGKKTVQVGVIGDYIQSPKARKHFSKVLDAPVYVSQKNSNTDMGFVAGDKRAVFIIPSAIERATSKDAFSETFFHETIHLQRNELGRVSEKGEYTQRVQEKSARKGADFWMQEGIDWAKTQMHDGEIGLNHMQEISDMGMALNKDRMLIVYSLMQMEDGIGILLNSGYTYADMFVIEKLFNKKENEGLQNLYKSFRNFLNEQGQRVQKVQEMIGETPIRFVENYFPLFGMLENEGIDSDVLNELIEGKQISTNIYSPWAIHRKGGGALKKLSFVETVSQYAESTEKFINLAPSLFDAQQILGNKEIRDAIKDFHGLDWYKRAWQHVNDWIAGPQKGNSAFEKIGGHFRRTAFPAYLGFNIFSVAKQPISWMVGAYSLGPAHAIRGLARWMQNPVSAYTEASSKSSLIRNRAFTQERDFAHLNSHSMLARKSKLWAMTKKGQKFALALHQIADIGTVSALWIAAYDKAKQVDLLSEEEARMAADELIVKTQPMGGNLYVPAVLRGSELAKLYTMFSNQSTQTLSVMIETIYDIKESDKNAIGKFMDATGASLMLVLGPAFILGMLSRKMHFSDEPEDYAFDVINYATAPIPFLGKFVYAGTTGRRWTSLTPVGDAFDDVINAVASDDPISTLYQAMEIGTKWGLGMPTENVKNIATGKFIEYKENK